MQNKLINVELLENNCGQIEGIKNNPRTIDASSYAKLKQSLTDYKDMLPLRELLVIPHGNKYVVIAGNQRLRALKELGYKEVYCKIIPQDTSHEFINAVIIKDNVDLGDWDYDMLANEWDELDLIEWGVDLPEDWADDEIDTTNGDEINENIQENQSFIIECNCLEDIAELKRIFKTKDNKINYVDFKKCVSYGI